jgi:bacteriorhodopsin
MVVRRIPHPGRVRNPVTTDVRHEMKTLRSIASAGVLSPLVVPLALGMYIVWTLSNRGASEATSWGAAIGFAVILYFLGIGTAFTFLIGLGLHGVVAAKTQHPCRWAWWFSLSICVVSMLVVRPIGTVLGGCVAALLLVAGPFKIMRRGVEPANAAYRR